MKSFGALENLTEHQGDGQSLMTVRTYDGAGRLSTETRGGRLERSLVYEDATGRLASSANATEETRFIYASAASPWPTSVESYESGPSCSAQVPTTTSTIVMRDAFGRVTHETGTDGTETQSDLDEAGRPLVMMTAGRKTEFAWDGAGSLVKLTRPEGRGFTEYGYDPDGRMRRKRASSSQTGVFETTYDYTQERLERITRPDGTQETFEYHPDDALESWTRRDGVRVDYTPDAANRPNLAQPAVPATLNLVGDAGERYVWDGLSRLLNVDRLTTGGGGELTANTQTSVSFTNLDLAGRPQSERVGTREPLTRTYNAFGKTTALGLPVGIGAAEATTYLRNYEACSDRLSTLTATSNGKLGATWAWSGEGRLLSMTTRGPLAIAHRYGWVGGPGVQPPSANGISPAAWRLGTLTIGSAQGLDAISQATEPLTQAWGRFAYGYRPGDNAKLGRQVTIPSLLASQGWAWEVDRGTRLTAAYAGLGSMTGAADPVASAKAYERFSFDYGPADQLTHYARELGGMQVDQGTGAEGRPASRTERPLGAPLPATPDEKIVYDAAGRRTEDGRFRYRWHWFGKVAEVEVKEEAETPWAGHEVSFEWDALGRLYSATHRGKVPYEGTEEQRPFIERREYLWEDAQLIAEVGKAEDGAIRWRYSYVPGPSGMDDQVQLRVERYDAAQGLVSDKVYAYLRDELGSVLGLVDEEGGTPEKPRLLTRYLYEPYGRAHVETGPEVMSAKFEQGMTSITRADGTSASQSLSDTAHVGGAMRVVLSLPVDVATLDAGVVVERLTDGAWGALTAAELAIGRSPEREEELLLLPLSGWELGKTWRVRPLPDLKDAYGRATQGAPDLEIAMPPAPQDGQVGGISISFEKSFPIVYEDYLAAGETLGGELPGGQPHLWQGHLVHPVLGLHIVRARVYDSRTASWVSPDPEEDRDSANVFGYVAGRPHEAVDPTGSRAATAADNRRRAEFAATIETSRMESVRDGLRGTAMANFEAAAQFTLRNWDAAIESARTDEYVGITGHRLFGGAFGGGTWGYEFGVLSSGGGVGDIAGMTLVGSLEDAAVIIDRLPEFLPVVQAGAQARARRGPRGVRPTAPPPGPSPSAPRINLAEPRVNPPEKEPVIGIVRSYDEARKNPIPGYEDHHLDPPLGRRDPTYAKGPTTPVRNDNSARKVPGGVNLHTAKGGFQDALNQHIAELGYTREQWNRLPDQTRQLHLRRYYAGLGIPYPK